MRLAVVCATAACEVVKSSHAPTAPSTEEPPRPNSMPVAHPGYPQNGEDLVAYIVTKYPDRLVATGDYDTRARNMEFVRDRMIDSGICGGMDLARNMKRGSGPISADAIAWRPDGVRVEVVDIASDWDNYGRPLELHWFIVSGPPGWSPVGTPAC